MSISSLAGRVLLCVFLLGGISGCTAMAVTGAVVGAATAVAVEVVEVPFEVAGGVYDVVTDDDDDDEEADEED